MSSVKLLEPLLEEGLRSTNFFNGRVLSAEDLKVDQQAIKSRDRLIGQSLGAGVVSGLKVSIVQSGGTVPILSITEGMAISKDGEVLELPSSVELELVQVSATPTGSSASPFSTCGNPSTGTTPTGTGSYVLVMGPASGLEGRAPVSTLSGAQADVCCRSRNVVDGVTFTLIRISPNNLSTTRPSLNRNLLAHYCFGTSKLIADTAKQILSSPETYEYSPLVKEKKIPSGQVPLAVLSWSSSGLDFVDLWAVRRSPIPPLEAPWQFMTGARRQAEALAMLHQFQDQLETLRLGKNPTTVTLQDNFRYLPAAGIVPLAVTTRDATGAPISTTAGFVQETFFSGVTVQSVVTLPPASVRALLFTASYFDPFDLTSVIQNKLPLTLIQLEGVTSYVIFTRPIGFVPEILDDTSNDATDDSGNSALAARTGGIQVTLTAARGSLDSLVEAEKRIKSDAQKAGVRAILKPGGTLGNKQRPAADPLADKVRVWVEDAVGTAHEGRSARANDPASGSLGYAITRLQPGTYKLGVKVTGFRESQKVVTLTAGQTLDITVALVPAKSRPPKKPRPGKKSDLLKSRGVQKLVVVDQPRWPYPPEEDWSAWDRVNPPDDVREWVEDWGDYVKGLSPDAAVDPGDTFLAIRPDYDAGKVSSGPYAYLVFGETGAATPVLLVSEAQALDREVGLSEAGVSGLDPSTQQELAALGLDSVDALGAAWSGLVEETLQVSSSTARTTIETARATTLQLGKKLSGAVAVDAATEKALSEHLGINNVSQLAKADAGEVQRQLTQQGLKLDAAYSQRLIDQARKASRTRGGL